MALIGDSVALFSPEAIDALDEVYLFVCRCGKLIVVGVIKGLLRGCS
jgi:hypothetical protein